MLDSILLASGFPMGASLLDPNFDADSLTGTDGVLTGTDGALAGIDGVSAQATPDQLALDESAALQQQQQAQDVTQQQQQQAAVEEQTTEQLMAELGALRQAEGGFFSNGDPIAFAPAVFDPSTSTTDLSGVFDARGLNPSSSSNWLRDTYGQDAVYGGLSQAQISDALSSDTVIAATRDGLISGDMFKAASAGDVGQLQSLGEIAQLNQIGYDQDHGGLNHFVEATTGQSVFPGDPNSAQLMQLAHEGVVGPLTAIANDGTAIANYDATSQSWLSQDGGVTVTASGATATGTETTLCADGNNWRSAEGGYLYYPSERGFDVASNFIPSAIASDNVLSA
ncbi:MAG: hypothetical protein ACRD3W_03060, partial [Terriglobales bacterium]